MTVNDPKHPLGGRLPGKLSAQELEEAMRGQGRSPRGGHSVLGESPATEEKVCRALAEQFGVPAVQLSASTLDTAVLSLIPEAVAAGHRVLPMTTNGDVLNLAIANPSDQSLFDEIAFASGKKTLAFVVPRGILDEAVHLAYRAKASGARVWKGPRSTHETPYVSVVTASQKPPPPPSPTIAPELDANLNTFPELPAPQPRASGEKKRILAVDDEVEILDILDTALSARGFEVLRATRGREALEKLRQYAPDIVLLDAMLPEIHGFEICSQIKHSPHYQHTPVIMISAIYTGWNFIQDVKRIHGADDYIEKPFRIMEVVRRVEEVLAAKAGGGSGMDAAAHQRAAQCMATASEALKKGQIEEGVAAAHRAVREDPFDPRAHFLFATALQRAGKLYEAISEYERVVELAPAQFSALKNLAALYERQGFKAKSVEMWTRALEQSPSDAVRQTIKSHLIGLL